VFRLGHFLPDLGIVGREPIISALGLDQKELLPCVGPQAVDYFFRQNDAKRVAELADLEIYHGRPSDSYSCSDNGTVAQRHFERDPYQGMPSGMPKHNHQPALAAASVAKPQRLKAAYISRQLGIAEAMP
jgi:hypothetical protein